MDTEIDTVGGLSGVRTHCRRPSTGSRTALEVDRLTGVFALYGQAVEFVSREILAVNHNRANIGRPARQLTKGACRQRTLGIEFGSFQRQVYPIVLFSLFKHVTTMISQPPS